MKSPHIIASIIALACLSVTSLHAQEVSDLTNLKDEDYTSITLPPIDVLFENAKSAPAYRITELKVQTEKYLLAKERRGFLSFFSLRGSYQYGMFGNESTYTDVSIAPYLTYSTQAQNGYTVGAGLSVPLDGLFDLKSRVKRQKLTLETAKLEREVKFDEMKRDIIELYTAATSLLRILKLRAESLELAKMQYSIAEQDFINGTYTSSELSMENERQSKALEAFEDTRAELINSLMLLEISTRTPLFKK
jgi:outer membrane protein TolC